MSHNRHAMENFTRLELKYLETYMMENYPEDILTGRIQILHNHSDNASHFKRCWAVNFFTSLIEDCGGPKKCAFVVSFGAPGHGKGIFDGFGLVSISFVLVYCLVLGAWRHSIVLAMKLINCLFPFFRKTTGSSVPINLIKHGLVPLHSCSLDTATFRLKQFYITPRQ